MNVLPLSLLPRLAHHPLSRRAAQAVATSSSSSSPLAAAAGARRSLATQRVNKKRLSPALLDLLPVIPEVDVVDNKPPNEETPLFPRHPITSAHCIDVDKQQASVLDSAALSPSGSVVHGRYGDLGPAVASSIPLEYLALLRPAAEGAAALRVLLSQSKHPQVNGTVLVYGASLASGLAATQLASTAGHAVVAVVSGNHSGNDRMVECVKGLVAEPGTAVPEEYALCKQLFAELVRSISSGDEGMATPAPEDYLADFKANLLDYVKAYPDTRPAAVSERHTEFKYMPKDKEVFESNMEAYLEQFPPGAPPIDPAKLDAFFTTEQYEVFRQKFWQQTSGVLSGDTTEFYPAHAVKHLSEAPEPLDRRTFPGAGPEFPYSFSVLKQFFPDGSELQAGGPIHGAIVCVTPTLAAAAGKVAAAAAAKTKRAQAEALQFLTHAQRAAFGAARSVVRQAQRAGAPVVAVGGALPGFQTVQATPDDVQEALAAMDVDEEGEARLNYFVQVYRANDFPFYADYAVHRASEELAGPRQIIVTK